jgi:dTMP kinase
LTYFITLEGGEGAGKSTQARRLADHLAASGIPVLLTREPGGAPAAEVLRDLLLGGQVSFHPQTEVLLHFAVRTEHIERTIRPALAAGMWVVCDRFADSTMVYQGHALGADRGKIATLTEMIGLRPDLTLVLDVPVPTTLARLTARGTAADRYERLGEGFFAAVRQGFLDIAAAEPGRCALLDATPDEDTVAASLIAAVRERLGAP